MNMRMHIEPMPGDDDPIETMVYLGSEEGGPLRILARAEIDLRTMEITNATSRGEEGARMLPEIVRRLKREPRRRP